MRGTGRAMAYALPSHLAICLALIRAIGRTRTVEEIYTIALDALGQSLGVSRASILLFDADGVMRFKAHRGLSEEYRGAVEGHTPWRPDSPDPEPIVVEDVGREPSLAPFLPTIRSEGIAAMAFIPLVSDGRVIGKFMLYYDTPRALSADEVQLAALLASQVAFAVERTRAEALARRSEERLRYALDTARMGTWEWDFATQSVRWSENLATIHGLPPGTFDGTFASYQREIHPEDADRVLASIQRAVSEGVPHDVEYRIVAPDGRVRWVDGKGRVEYENGQPVRMSGVCMDVTRRKEAELARLSAAEEASRLKDEFLATLSHELRTPLNSILGWVQLLEDGGLPPERIRQALEVIGRNARLQARLIEDILDISRIIAGKLEIEHEPVLVSRLVEAVVGAMQPAAEDKHVALVSAVPDDLPPIEGDSKRLHQMLGNVVSNAIKFTPAGGCVEVCCAVEGGVITIEVRDTGIGIARELLPYVFERFRQADSGSTRRHGGLGLGLAIARHLAEQHGGEIRADSEGVGRGTRVVLRLPAGSNRDRTSTHRAAAVSPSIPPLRLHGTTVLVVDDHADARELLAALFDGCGARVVPCDSAEAALAVLSASPVDLVVADIAMPDVDGHELIRRVRQQGHRVHAIAVSAYARPEDRGRALASGYEEYCTKPIDAAQLLEAVRSVLNAY
jgi:PAS domain S-box-containing protein